MVKTAFNRMKKRRGSAAVLITVLFVAMTVGISAVYEAASRRAAESMAELAYQSAGRSVLSCYDKELQERYGIFGFEAADDEIEAALKDITDESFKESKLISCKNISVHAEKAAFSLSVPKNLNAQIRVMMKGIILDNSVDELFDMFTEAHDALSDKKGIYERIKELEASRDAAEEAQRERENSEDYDGSGEHIDFSSVKNVHNMLKNVAEDAENDDGAAGTDIVLKNRRISATLPSEDMDSGIFSAFSGDSDSFGTGGAGISGSLLDNIYITEYVMHFMGNHIKTSEAGETFFKNESEYILYGNLSDEKNYKKARRSIKAMRTALNIAYLYADTEKRTLTMEAAEMLTPGPFGVLTQLLIISAWGAVESSNDMKNLEAGNSVPLWKTGSTWMTDLDGILNGVASENYIPIESDSIMTYQYYIRILLLTENNEEKLYRIMDIIQINMKGMVREEFTISDHYTGFSMNASVKKKSRGVGIPSSSAYISMTHLYESGD